MTWAISNSEQMVPREHIYGTIRGVDFGPSVSVIARGIAPMLLWLGGHSWSLNGSQRYAQSNLTLIRDRRAMDGWRNYKSFKPEGGRLTVARVEIIKEPICAAFGEERWPGILHAVATRQTLLVEGGGEEPQPSAKKGWEAYQQWRERQDSTRSR